MALILGWTELSEGTGLVAALAARNANHVEASWAESYFIFVAPREANEKDLPEPKLVQLPATSGVYEAKDWWVTPLKVKGAACFIPEGSLLTITSLAETKIIGSVIWPVGYKEEPKRCSDRQFPRDGICDSDKAPAQIGACSNGAILFLDFSEAVDVYGKPLNPAVLMAEIKKALGN